MAEDPCKSLSQYGGGSPEKSGLSGKRRQLGDAMKRKRKGTSILTNSGGAHILENFGPNAGNRSQEEDEGLPEEYLRKSTANQRIGRGVRVFYQRFYKKRGTARERPEDTLWDAERKGAHEIRNGAQKMYF